MVRPTFCKSTGKLPQPQLSLRSQPHLPYLRGLSFTTPDLTLCAGSK